MRTTRKARLLEAVEAVRSRIASKRRWVQVQVAPGHTCCAPFVTLDPRDAADIEELLQQLAAVIGWAFAMWIEKQRRQREGRR